MPNQTSSLNLSLKSRAHSPIPGSITFRSVSATAHEKCVEPNLATVTSIIAFTEETKVSDSFENPMHQVSDCESHADDPSAGGYIFRVEEEFKEVEESITGCDYSEELSERSSVSSILDPYAPVNVLYSVECSVAMTPRTVGGCLVGYKGWPTTVVGNFRDPHFYSPVDIVLIRSPPSSGLTDEEASFFSKATSWLQKVILPCWSCRR